MRKYFEKILKSRFLSGKKLFTLLFIITAFSARGDYWTQKADFGGAPRQGAVGFSIGTKGYIGTGLNGGTTFSDFWEYDPAINVWTQKANFGGMSRCWAVGFSIGTKGYIGTGIFGSVIKKDFWEYDPSLNAWTQKLDFGGNERYHAVGFSINNKGYIGTGFNGTFLKDFWEYDPLLNVWSQKMDFGGIERALATGFSDGIKGYLGTGTDFSIHPDGRDDFWAWDPNTNAWSQKANIGGGGRSEGSGFWLCPFGYVLLGTNQIGTGTTIDLWKYNISSNTWSQAADFSGGLREMAVAFSIGTKGYAGTGFSNDDNTTCSNDFWEYTPDSACTTGIEELPTSNLEFTISPNPAKDFLIINYDRKEKINLTITDVNGKVLTNSQIPNPKSQIKIDIHQFSKGIYFVEASNGKQKAVKRFLKE